MVHPGQFDPYQAILTRVRPFQAIPDHCNPIQASAGHSGGTFQDIIGHSSSVSRANQGHSKPCHQQISGHVTPNSAIPRSTPQKPNSTILAEPMDAVEG